MRNSYRVWAIFWGVVFWLGLGSCKNSSSRSVVRPPEKQADAHKNETQDKCSFADKKFQLLELPAAKPASQFKISKATISTIKGKDGFPVHMVLAEKSSQADHVAWNLCTSKDSCLFKDQEWPTHPFGGYLPSLQDFEANEYILKVKACSDPRYTTDSSCGQETQFSIPLAKQNSGSESMHRALNELFEIDRELFELSSQFQHFLKSIAPAKAEEVKDELAASLYNLANLPAQKINYYYSNFFHQMEHQTQKLFAAQQEGASLALTQDFYTDCPPPSIKPPPKDVQVFSDKEAIIDQVDDASASDKTAILGPVSGPVDKNPPKPKEAKNELLKDALAFSGVLMLMGGVVGLVQAMELAAEANFLSNGNEKSFVRNIIGNTGVVRMYYYSKSQKLSLDALEKLSVEDRPKGISDTNFLEAKKSLSSKLNNLDGDLVKLKALDLSSDEIDVYHKLEQATNRSKSDYFSARAKGWAIGGGVLVLGGIAAIVGASQMQLTGNDLLKTLSEFKDRYESLFTRQTAAFTALGLNFSSL